MYSTEEVYKRLEKFVKRENKNIQKLIGDFTWERNPYVENLVVKGKKCWYLGEINPQRMYLEDMRGNEFILKVK